MAASVKEAFTQALTNRTGGSLDCYGCGETIAVDEVDTTVGFTRQLRRLWFNHMRRMHTEEYRKVSPDYVPDYPQ